MNAGLPTTGIGGIFYFFSILLMIVYEIYLSARRKSSIQRWIVVIRQFSITTGILLAIIITGVIIQKISTSPSVVALTSIDTSITVTENSRIIFFTPFIILFSLIGFTQILRVYFRIKQRLQSN